MLSDFLYKLLEAAGILKAEADAKFEELKASEPTLEAAIQKFQDYVWPKLAPLLDADSAVALVRQIGKELMSGHTTYDPGHWSVG